MFLLFLVVFVAIVPAGTARAALSLNNFVGFETDGLEEAVAAGSTSIITDARSGDWAMRLEGGGFLDLPMITGGSTNSDNDFIFGFGVNFGARTNTDVLVRFLDDAGGEVANLTHVATGELRLVDAAGATVVTTSSTPFAADGVYYFVEVSWQHSASGAFDVHVDGVSEISETGVDLTDGGAIGPDAAVYQLVGDVGQVNRPVFDDLYMYSGATGTGDFLGDASVFRYQANTNSATPDSGNDLDQGVWQDLGETPVSSDATEPAYTGGALAGEVYTNDTQSGDNYRPGPSGDCKIEGGFDIKGGKWLHRLRRGNGSGTVHQARYGNDIDAIQSQTVTLGTGYANFFTVSQAANAVPLSSEHFAMGFEKDGGSRELFAEEMFAFILGVPGVDACRRIFNIQ